MTSAGILQGLPNEIVELLNETDPAARAGRWSALRKSHPRDLERPIRKALLSAWLDDSAGIAGEITGRAMRGDDLPPTLFWLIPEYPTALECLSDLRAESLEAATRLVRIVLQLTQPAAAFFYAGARSSGYPMAVLKKVKEQRKVAFGINMQRAADELNIYVPSHLRIRWVKEMKLPRERFGLEAPATEQPRQDHNVETSTEQQRAVSSRCTLPEGPSHEAPNLRQGTTRRPEKPLQFFASLMDGPSTEEVLEMANLPYPDEIADKLWAHTNWKDLLSACPSADITEEMEQDGAPCQSDILYKITIIYPASFPSELRDAIFQAVRTQE